MAGGAQRFTLEFTPDAVEDLRSLRKFEQRTVVDRIESQLRAQATTETRNRKPLRPNDLAKWELRLGSYRVFYDVDEAVTSVKVKAIGRKEHNKLMIRGREYQI